MSKEIPGVFHNDPKMSPEDLNQVDIFSEGECSDKWLKYVSAVSRHFMQMQDDQWPVEIVSGHNSWFHWLQDWNNEDFSKFSSRLQTIGIPKRSTLIIFWMKKIGLKTNWGVFCNNWANFLYEDEGCILVLPEHKESLVLSNGSAWLGTRSAPKT